MDFLGNKSVLDQAESLVKIDLHNYVFEMREAEDSANISAEDLRIPAKSMQTTERSA